MWCGAEGRDPLNARIPCLAAHLLRQALPLPSCSQALLSGATKPKEGFGSPSHCATPGTPSEHLSKILDFGAEKIFSLVLMSGLVLWSPEFGLRNGLYQMTK